MIISGEYDPRRAEQELLRRLDARQDIKAAHKACLHASNGNLAPLLELIEAANDTEGGADSASRLYLVEAISQAGKEAIGAISASHPIITALSAWSLEALDESLRGLGGAWVVTESQRLIDAIATLLMKMPFSLRAQLEALRSSGLIESMKRVASESKLQSATRDQVLSWLHKWEPLSKPSGAAAPPSSQLPPPLRPSSASSKPHSSLHDFLPSFLQPTPLSSSAAAKVGVSANNNVKNTTNGSVGGSGGALRTGPVVAPAAGTALSELEVSQIGQIKRCSAACLTIITI